MPAKRSSLTTIRRIFRKTFASFEIRIPDENLRERKKGSLPYGSGRLYYIFGEEGGVEYLEYYAYHRMGDCHGRIYADGRDVSLDYLDSMICYSPGIPGDREKNEKEMRERYQRTLDDLVAKGLFDDEPVPTSLAVNSHFVLHPDDDSSSQN
jgi:hypothetical protein